MDIRKNAFAFLTFEDLFGRKSDYNELEQKIERQDNIAYMLPLLSQLASLRPNSNDYALIVSDFMKYLDFLMKRELDSAKELYPEFDVAAGMKEIQRRFKNVMRERVFSSPQVSMFLMKHLMVLGSFDSDKEIVDSRLDYIETITMLLMTADHTSPPSINGILVEVFRSYMFYSMSELGTHLSRTLYIYCDLARKEELFGNEFVNINKKFEEQFGCSVEDYIFILFAMYVLFQKKLLDKSQLTYNWFQDVDFTFKQTKLTEVANDIVKSISFTFEEANEELKETYKNPWEFKFFMEKPLFKFKDEAVFPVNMKFLEDNFYEGLFWKMRSCYPEDDSSFQAFLEDHFEMYGQNLIHESCKKSNVPYEFIPEFEYTKPGTSYKILSPDIIVRLGSKLLVVECKAQRINYTGSIINGDMNSIEADRVKMTVKPMKQLYTRMTELLNGASEEVKFDGINELFLIVVNQGVFPVLKPLHDKTLEDWKQLEGINIETNLYVMDVEELEMLASIIEKQKPIFGILKHKNHFKYAPIKNFLSKQHRTLKRPQILSEALDKLSELSEERFI